MDSDTLERAARIELGAYRETAIRVKFRADSRIERLRQAGASSATVREECYRVTRADRRRATVRADGTIPLRGDKDYLGRRFAVCLFPVPSSPGMLRVAGKVSAPAVDDARAEDLTARAIAACDARANTLHAARASAEREIRALIMAHRKSTGARRKALTYKINATLRNAGPSVIDAARTGGWRI